MKAGRLLNAGRHGSWNGGIWGFSDCGVVKWGAVRWLRAHLTVAIRNARSGVRTHAEIPPVDLKSTALTTRPSWHEARLSQVPLCARRISPLSRTSPKPAGRQAGSRARVAHSSAEMHVCRYRRQRQRQQASGDYRRDLHYWRSSSRHAGERAPACTRYTDVTKEVTAAVNASYTCLPPCLSVCLSATANEADFLQCYRSCHRRLCNRYRSDCPNSGAFSGRPVCSIHELILRRHVKLGSRIFVKAQSCPPMSLSLSPPLPSLPIGARGFELHLQSSRC